MSLALVTCMFNPCNYSRRNANYDLFAAGIQASGCKLYCVELAFDGQAPRCRADVKIDLAGDERNLLWQKEALLNIGLQAAIADGHEFVGWIDADLTLSPDWHVGLHEHFRTEIPTLVHLGATLASEWSDRQPLLCKSAVAHLNEPFAYRGYPGGGWIARRQFWQGHRLFDRCIAGGGDWAMFCGYALRAGGSPTFQRFAQHHRELAAPWREWCETFPGEFHLAALPQTVRALAHGSLTNRQYQKRPALLRDFDPADVRCRADGVLEWASDKPTLHRAIRDYFFGRREDE